MRCPTGCALGWVCDTVGDMSTKPSVITRQETKPGVYRYEIDGAEFIKSSKVLYTHATVYFVNDYAAGPSWPLTMHKNSATMLAAPARKHSWSKVDVIEITPI